MLNVSVQEPCVPELPLDVATNGSQGPGPAGPMPPRSVPWIRPGLPLDSMECCGLPLVYGDWRRKICHWVTLPAPSVATLNVQTNEFASVRVETPSLNEALDTDGRMSVSGRNAGSGLAVVNVPITCPPRTYGAV